ncbi:hypothetical protein [Bacillus sp. 0102A]|uniref:hypothetical protein n=1 Tax=Bacillus sp. 0102A TaxID=3120563 RepID=UPI002FDB3A31
MEAESIEKACWQTPHSLSSLRAGAHIKKDQRLNARASCSNAAVTDFKGLKKRQNPKTKTVLGF